MQALAILVAPIVVKYLTDFLKVPVPAFAENRLLMIRVILAVMSLFGALLNSWLLGSPFDGALVTVVFETAINFVGASGWFHLTTKAD